MTAEYARMEWDRALEALRSARLLVRYGEFDSAASRAYYAAFHAVTALFAIEGRSFTKHSALESAVHRDLVKAGRWSTDLGRDFRFRAEARSAGDYGTDVRLDVAQATAALQAAGRIVRAAHSALPADFAAAPGDDEHDARTVT